MSVHDGLLEIQAIANLALAECASAEVTDGMRINGNCLIC